MNVVTVLEASFITNCLGVNIRFFYT